MSALPAVDAALYGVLTLFVAFVGACLGSFLNVCIYRIPREESVVIPGSHCPACNTPIHWYHNLPVISYLALRGRCAACGQRFSARYCLVELLTAALFLLVWFKLDLGSGARWGLIPVTDWKLMPVYWLVIMGLVLGTFVDFEHMIIPDRVTLGGMLTGVILSAAVPSLHGRETHLAGLVDGLIGCAVGFGSLWIVGEVGRLIFRKEAMGFGDVKLMGAIGAYFGWPAVLFTIMAASLAGSIVGVSLLIGGRKQLQSRIPFGPYLALGALVWMFWGAAWWHWYLDLMLRR